MTLHPIYHTDDSRLLLDAEARELVRAGGVAGLVWGLVCLLLALVTLAEGRGAGVALGIALAMVAAGIVTACRPVRALLWLHVGLNAGLLAWNAVQAVGDHRAGHEVAPTGLVLPAIVLVAFAVLHRRLGVMSLAPAERSPERLARLRQCCREVLDQEGDAAVDFADGVHRLVAVGDVLFLVSPSHRRDLVADREAVAALLVDPKSRRPELRVEHPLGELLLSVNKTNARKLKQLLAS